MPYAAMPTLGAGSVIEYEDPATAGSWIALENALNIGQVGEQGESIEVTPIGATSRQYISGLDTPPDKTMSFNHSRGVAEYDAFMTLAQARANVRMRVRYNSGDTATFSVALLGMMMQEVEGGAQLKMDVFAKQSGSTEWTETSA